MLAEKIARKPLNIGPYHLDRGDVVSDDVEALLPPGRMKVLLDQGWISERPVNASNQSGGSLDDLVARLAVLEEKVAQLEAKRGPGRPRKVEE